MPLVIVGLTSDDKVPGAYAETLFGQGKLSIGAQPQKMLVCGNMLGSGAVPDVDVKNAIDEAGAATLWGGRSELTAMARAALQNPGVLLYGAAVTVAGTAATLELTLVGTATSAGEILLRFGGRTFRTAIASGDTITVAGDNIEADILADADLYCTPVNAVGVITFSVASNGIRGNQHLAALDVSNMPTGMTASFTAGGTAKSLGRRFFGSGATADDVTALLAVLFPGTYDYQAWAESDAVNAGLVVAQANTKAGPLEGRLEHVGFAGNGALAATITIAQGLNEQRACYLWMENSEWHPSRLAASVMGFRSTVEGSQPNTNWDNVKLKGSPQPQADEAEIPAHASLKSALNNSVSPLATTPTGEVAIVRGITTHSLNGTDPDYRTLDWAAAIVPDRVRKEIVSDWVNEYVIANPFVGPDVAESAAVPQQGLATPRWWNSRVEGKLRRWATSDFNWLTEIDTHLPESDYDSDAERIMTAVPVKVLAQQHQIGISVRQVA